MTRKSFLFAGASALTFTLGACGGGGGGVASIPPPRPTPTPGPVQAPATTLPIIDNAPTGELAVAGTASLMPYSAAQPLANMTIDPANLPSFRYDASTDIYEIKVPSGSWETLYSPAPQNTVANRTQAWTDGGVQLDIGRERTLINNDTEWSRPYAYSTIVSGNAAEFGFGWFALGIPTPDSGLPTSGSATFSGQIVGWSDYLINDGYGDMVPSNVGGTVELNFNFGASQLTGAISPNIGTTFYSDTTDSLGVFTFRNTVYSAGAFSGQFNSSATGINGFNGQLTGPNGEELIGGWALPFHYAGDGQDHQAIGAWIAKRP